MKREFFALLACGIGLVSASQNSQAQVTMAADLPFGGGDGWLAPGEGGYTFLGTGNNERGIAYGNGHLYLVSRNGGNFIRILDQNTGADLGALNTTGITGGTFAVNSVAVGGDGTIYVNNLTIQPTTSPLKVYAWASEAATPTVAYSGNAGLAGSRVGDDIAVFGSGASTRLALGYNSTPAVAGNNGYAIVDPTAGTATAVGFAATPPNAGDFRLGITMTGANTVLGTAGSSLYRATTFSGSTGTLNGSPAIPDPSGATADRLLAYDVLGGKSLLAVQSIGDSHVSIYDVSNPLAPVWLASGDNASGTLTANGNASGELAWGATTTNPDGSVTQVLYAMSSNQGIQAFDITVPEPSTMALSLVGGLFVGATALRRRFKK
jgi:hypothetical protein